MSVGIVGGLALGCREALLTLAANAFIQPEQYFSIYVATPVLAWMVLGMLLMIPCAIAIAAARRVDATRALPLYATIFAFFGASSVTVPQVPALNARLADVGVHLQRPIQFILWALALGISAAAALIVGAAIEWYASRVRHPLRGATRVAVVILLVTLWPVGRFFASDWKWRPSAPPVTAAAPAQPNVVLISIDTLRADHLGSYGNTERLTPRLDDFAENGVLFEHTITSSPWTLPAMASLFTARYPRAHGTGAITNRRDPLGRSALRPNSWTLATALHTRGYRTHAIVTNPYLALRYGLGQGFDTYENVSIESEVFLAFGNTTALRLLTWLRPEIAIGDRGATVSRRARQWLDRLPDDRPFFLWVHYIDPHPPYSRAGATRHKSFRGDILFEPGPNNSEEITLTSPDVARLRSGEIRLSAVQKEAVRDLYRAEVGSVDEAVGAVLDTLDQHHLRDRTLVVCVADHGEEFWEHGGVEHGHTVYDELVHVPLLMRWPDHLPAGARIDGLTRITDVAPTILDLVSAPIPSGLDGDSLMPLVHGAPAAARAALTENLLFAEERIGLRTSQYTYVRWDDGKEEVYDRAADPHERHDLAVVGATLLPLRQLYAQVVPDSRVADVHAPPLDGGTAEALRALGYAR